jgi:CubicO group peptidase (beta-lactamase class C family)
MTSKSKICYAFLPFMILAIIRPLNILGVENCLLGSFPLNTSESSTFQNKFGNVKAKIIDFMEETGACSVSVAVAKDGKIIWEESFGWANREKLIKANPHTMYSLASISKPITATGLMILIEKGLVDLNKSINSYLGRSKILAFEGNESDATVKHVLNHTSGLPLHWQFFYEHQPFHPPSMEETIGRYGILVAAPGEIYEYSNLGFGILGHVISRISGKSYQDFMKAEVFLPLGMDRTSVGIGSGLEDYAAQRYDEDQKPIPFYDFDHPGASAVFSSAHDLVRFGMFHLKDHLPDQKQILKDETIDSMKVEKDPNAPNKEYRFGWREKMDDHGYRSISHTGGMPGVSAEIKLIPSEDIALVVLCNSRLNPVYEIDNEILAALLPRFARNIEAEKSKAEKKVDEKSSLPETLLGKWEGHIKTYSGVMPIQMIFQNDGDIHVKIENQLETLLNSVDFKDCILTGVFNGEVKTEDASRFPHTIHLKMQLREKRLYGYANATARPFFSLSSWIELRRNPDF